MLSKAAVKLIVLHIGFVGSAAGVLRLPATESPAPWPVRLVISDRFGLPGSFLATIRGDVQSILRAVDIEVTWSSGEPADENNRSRDQRVSGSFLVVLAGKSPSDWGVTDEAMGAVASAVHLLPYVIVFPERVLQVMEPHRQADRPPKYNRTMARAFAKVVVHELVHAIAPEHSHSVRGLMRSTLDRAFLLDPELQIDAGCRAAIVGALQALADPVP